MSDLSKSTLDELVEFSGQLAEASGRAILPYFRTNTAIENKLESDFDPVTEGDRAGERAIRALIERQYAHHGIIGEEFGSQNEGADFCWIIDPIDGTRGFISGAPLWGTLIGCLFEGKPFLGVLDQPYLQERLIGVTSKEHRRASVSARTGHRTLRTRSCRTLAEATLTTTSPVLFDEGPEKAAYDGVEDACKLVRYSMDCYGYGLLAMGCLDIVVESGLAPYDILALIPIIEAAGGQVTDWRGNPPLDGGQILATGDARLHQKALDILSPAAS